MLRKFTLLATAASALTASAAMAEEHVILIMPEAYFPDISYVDPGDSLRFVNTTETEHNIVSDGEAWTIGPIAAGGEAVVAVAGGMDTTFYNADATDVDDADGDGDITEYVMVGDLSFAAAPLD